MRHTITAFALCGFRAVTCYCFGFIASGWLFLEASQEANTKYLTGKLARHSGDAGAPRFLPDALSTSIRSLPSIFRGSRAWHRRPAPTMPSPVPGPAAGPGCLARLRVCSGQTPMLVAWAHPADTAAATGSPAGARSVFPRDRRRRHSSPSLVCPNSFPPAARVHNNNKALSETGLAAGQGREPTTGL